MSKLYRFLIYLYPRAFRQRHGEAMMQLFEDRVREETAKRVWRDVAFELCTTLPKEHWRTHPLALSLGLSLATLLWIAALPPRLNYLSLDVLPEQVDGWVARADLPIEEGVLKELGTIDCIQRVYLSGGSPAFLLVARWKNFRFGKSAESQEGLAFETLPPTTIQVSDGKMLTAYRARVSVDGSQAVVFYWWASGNYMGLNWQAWLAKLGLAIRTHGTAVVRVVVPANSPREEQEALTKGTEFVQAIYPELIRVL